MKTYLKNNVDSYGNPEGLHLSHQIFCKIPKYLYHRTSYNALLKIIQDKKILCTGTPASHKRFQCKFDSNNNDKWQCIFLGKTIRITAEMTWCGDIVLKIKTENLDKTKFELDQGYNGSFKYKSNIPFSEVCKIIKSNRKKIVNKSFSKHDFSCDPRKNPYLNYLNEFIKFV